MGYFLTHRISCCKELLEEVKQIVEKKQKSFGLICAFEANVEHKHDITLPDEYHAIYPDDGSYLDITIKIKIK